MIAASIGIALSVCTVSAFAAIAHETAARNGLILRVVISVAGAAVSCIGIVELCAGRGPSWTGGGVAVAIACCGISALTDAQTGYVFDAVNYPATVLVLALNALDGTLAGSFGGALCAGGTLGAIYILSRGRGIGLGDVKLAICLGASVGAAAAGMTLGIAFVLGGAVGAYLLAAKRAARGDTIRFAPYLAAAFCGLLVFRHFV
ncbi:MAG: prepilin peptidase [Vulcanimicrobiaceae bacterium]